MPLNMLLGALSLTCASIRKKWETRCAFGLKITESALTQKASGARSKCFSESTAPLKHLEQAPLAFWVNADSVILKPKALLVSHFFRMDAHVRLNAPSNIFNGIFQKITDALSQTCLVAQHRKQWPLDRNFGSRRLKIRPFTNNIQNQLFCIQRFQRHFLPRQTGKRQDMHN